MAKIKITEKTAQDTAKLAAEELKWHYEVAKAQFISDFESRVKPIIYRLGLDYDRYKEILSNEESEQSVAEYIENDFECGFSEKFELNQ